MPTEKLLQSGLTIRRHIREVWKEIPDYPFYRISNFGRVSGKKVDILRYHYNVYLYVDLFNEEGRKRKAVHQLVIESFGPSKPSPTHEPNHKDGDKHNNKISNLEWVTRKENMEHAVETGLMIIKSGSENHWYGKSQSRSHKRKRARAMRGSKNHQSKLNEDNLKEIRKLLNTSNLSQTQIGLKFGISQTTVGEIKRGEIWGWVE